ncbi:ATPase domain-containing protein [Corallococcus macrosporus]|uniref:non-specific serine/threonine protein kinase n=1 Tax=Corallococcus macrosporus DSM 14697 TaxID=1189310 RepID=A0A250JUE8_9BACT|nr:ATPase domain-containing protein [Corallococcus macrosporus]ATB47323.1 circadian clock protein KaiC [Corallococcus macrosporus DSM 14697]
MDRRTWSLFETGIPSFDALLGGGIPRRQSLIVAGDPGCGKTVLCSQVAFLAAARGLPVVLVTVTSEPHDKLVGELTSFSFFKEALLDDKLFVMSAYSSLKQGARETRDLIIQTVRKRGAKLLFIDGLRAIRDLWQDEARLREFLYELGIGLAAADCIGLFTTEYPLEKLLTLPEATTVDGLVSLSVTKLGARRMRRVEVVKLRGRPHLAGAHLMRIDGEGVSFIPRLEALASAGSDTPPPEGRVSFGLPELDALMEGGLPRTSATLLAGSMGIGKTLLAAHFAAEGARLGEHALFVSFHDSTASLAARARRIRLDVERYVTSGMLIYLYIPPLELEADLVVDRILQEVARRNVKRLVIDGLTTLEQSIVDPERRQLFLAALAERLRRAGVTTLYTREVSKVAGTELDFSDAPVSILGENLLLLRYVELRGRIHRLLSVLKMRDSKYDNDLREFQIADSGMKVLATMRSAEGLLTGQARPLGTRIGAEE